MNYGEGALSASDVALLNNCGRNNSNDGFGDGNAWWIVLFLIFALGGWGRGFGGFGGGYGSGFGGSTGGVTDGYVLASDFAQVDRKLDSISNGICDSTFALNNTMTNGFANVQNTLCQGFSGVNNAITTNGYETRLGVQGLSASLANCCCDLKTQIVDCCCTTQRGIDGINYNMAMNTNTLQNAMCLNTRDIIDNQNANYRALHDEIVANRIEDKNAQIAAQQNEINSLRLQASQANQNVVLQAAMDANTAEIIRRTGNDCPVNAYVVQPPTPVQFPTNCCGQFTGYNGYGYNNNCGCNNCCC